jgi:RNA polymerase sigma factor (sigma-70 family)
MDDREFVRRCIQGDKQSWNEFVERYSRLIYNYIYSILKIKGIVLTQENIPDLFQEVFLSLIKDNFKKLKSFKAKNKCSLASWLRQVTVNHTIDYLRKIKPAVSLDEEDEEGFSLKEILADDSLPIADTITDKERLAYLTKCIDNLDKEDQYFLELYINRGLTLEELKDHFKVSRSAIDMRKFRIIERLKSCFKGKGFKLDLR